MLSTSLQKPNSSIMSSTKLKAVEAKKNQKQIIQLQMLLGSHNLQNCSITHRLLQATTTNATQGHKSESQQVIAVNHTLSSQSILVQKTKLATIDQRLTHWKLFLAFAFPGFFLSTTRESLVKKPAGKTSEQQDQQESNTAIKDHL